MLYVWERSVIFRKLNGDRLRPPLKRLLKGVVKTTFCVFKATLVTPKIRSVGGQILMCFIRRLQPWVGIPGSNKYRSGKGKKFITFWPSGAWNYEVAHGDTHGLQRG